LAALYDACFQLLDPKPSTRLLMSTDRAGRRAYRLAFSCLDVVDI
jgi:hypothetical protein